MKLNKRVDLVIGAYIIKNNKILLIHHKKLNAWLPPGGHIKKNETPDKAVKREVKEELGIDINILNRNDISQEGNVREQLAIPIYANVHCVGDHDHCCFFYLCTLKNNQSIKINEELKGFKWFSGKDIENKTIPVDVKNQASMALERFNELRNKKDFIK